MDIINQRVSMKKLVITFTALNTLISFIGVPTSRAQSQGAEKGFIACSPADPAADNQSCQTSKRYSEIKAAFKRYVADSITANNGPFAKQRAIYQAGVTADTCAKLSTLAAGGRRLIPEFMPIVATGEVFLLHSIALYWGNGQGLSEVVAMSGKEFHIPLTKPIRVYKNTPEAGNVVVYQINGKGDTKAILGPHIIFDIQDTNNGMSFKYKRLSNCGDPEKMLPFVNDRYDFQIEVPYIYAAGKALGSRTIKEEQNLSLALMNLEHITAITRSWRAHYLLGETQMRMGKLAPAFANVNSALKAHPLSDQSLELRGHLYALMGDKEKAKADFLKALEVSPSNRDAQKGLDDVLAK